MRRRHRATINKVAGVCGFTMRRAQPQLWLRSMSRVIGIKRKSCVWESYLQTKRPGLGGASDDPGAAKIFPEGFLPGNSDRESS